MFYGEVKPDWAIYRFINIFIYNRVIAARALAKPRLLHGVRIAIVVQYEPQKPITALKDETKRSHVDI